MVPGRKFCTTTSLRRARSRNTSRPSSACRSRQRLRLLRLTWAWKNDSGGFVPGRNGGRRRTTSPPGSSILTTSAPRSASTQPHIGPASVVVASSTRTPASGPETGAGDGSKKSDWSTPPPLPAPEGTPAAGGPSGAGKLEDRSGGGHAGGAPAAAQGERGHGHQGGEETEPHVEAGDVVVAQTPADRRRAGQADGGRGAPGPVAGRAGVDGGDHRRQRRRSRLRRRGGREAQVGRAGRAGAGHRR